MNAFEVVVTPEAEADIVGLDPVVQTRILTKLEWMGENGELLRHEPLHAEQ